MKSKNHFGKASGIILLILFFITSVLSAQRKEMPFEKYNFVRTKFDTKDIEYLMGNAEMGGLADTKGLGFQILWFADVWKDSLARIPVEGPLFICGELENRDFSEADFFNELEIKNGIYSTRVKFDDGLGYNSTIFFSKKDKHRLVISLKNTSNKKLSFRIKLHRGQYKLNTHSSGILTGENDSCFSKIQFAINASKRIDLMNEFVIESGEEITFFYSATTQFDGDDYKEQGINAVNPNLSVNELIAEQKETWDRHWRDIASVILPESGYAKWFYRALYTIYATAGSDKFLPGEEMFSYPDSDWQMHSFTYGHGGGWPIWLFAQLGDFETAMKMLKEIYKPQSLKENVKILFPQPGPVKLVYRGKEKGEFIYLSEYNPDAIAFGHEVNTFGHNVTYTTDRHWDWQRHIDGFASAFFHLMDRLYPDKNLTDIYTYPVLRGTAEFYRGLFKWDDERNFYYLPPLLSVSENIMEKSVLDAVLSARWNLKTAVKYAERLGKDRELAEKWNDLYEKICIPQNDTTYLEFLDDKQDRTGGGYFGIRAFVYLGFPVLEEIKNIDIEKARRALDFAWSRNKGGRGMITFITNWFALTESYLGYGDNAYMLSNLSTQVQDSSGTALCEAISYDGDGNEHRITPYFLTGYDALALVPISMMIQSYDNKIKLFPSMPKEISDAEFYDLAAEGGIRVSAVYSGGKITSASFTKDGEIIKESSGVSDFIIGNENGKTLLLEDN